jgi:hypothetical protein
LRQFYQLNAQGVYEPLPVGPEGVVRSTVLPGFQWRLADLERRPPFKTLTADPVYRGYVRLEYQEQQALVQQERQRAEQERQRAERLHARLRALGVDPDASP